MKRLLLILKSFLPKRLPIGLTEFNDWVAIVVAISGLPDNRSTRMLAAQFIMHSAPDKLYLTPRFFSKQLVKAAAMQVANAVLKGQTNDGKPTTAQETPNEVVPKA